MDFIHLRLSGGSGQLPEDDGSHHSNVSETCTLPAYLRAPEVTSQVMAEYIWIMTGTGQLRSKTKVLDTKPATPEEAPVMVVESNPGGQTAEPNLELFLKPRKLFRDPFRGGDHILVLCDAFVAGEVGATSATVLHPSESNSRVACENVMKVAQKEEPVFAVEQEYAIIHPAYPTKVPLGPRRPSVSRNSSNHSSRRNSYVSCSHRSGVSKSSNHGAKPAPAAMVAAAAAAAGIPCPVPDPDMMCGGGKPETSAAQQKAARVLADAHLRCCLFAGVKVTGADVHSLDGLHSYKIGPSQGVDLGDDLWTSRYLLKRVAEDHGQHVSWEPDSMPFERPLGCYYKYSTSATRASGPGLSAIEQQLVRLQATHVQHQVAYNDGRIDRLSSDAAAFTHAVGSGNASIVVPSLTFLQQGGYYTDRRPPSDADPYKVALLLAATTMDIPLPKLPAACSTAISGPASAPIAPLAMPAAMPVQMPYSPMGSYLLANQRHAMYDSDSEECDSVDEGSGMTEDSAALLAKMDDCDEQGGESSCESDFAEEDDASSSPMTADNGKWMDEEASHGMPMLVVGA
ncbi:hypothetical protein HYH03_017622 [Edaphochlamys debaryana]|uniref:glutamine synthetase n=1 Tax=Edaphochlamys debaryana TaxID=47281 RepID=A0A835XM59_9CHLO|nr:hypothetical protein HYH03_017622 [Edaphochlamys debaryana]|eukprot:KAG2483515.1 hypothetical protein HYH03_017622 [Edaphochlamys debaryana]